MHTSFGRLLLAGGVVAVAAACSSDSTSPPSLKGPDAAANCQTGTIANNGTVTGTISASSDCRLFDAGDNDTVTAASYGVGLTAGKIYSVTTVAQGSSGDPTNELFGPTVSGDTAAVAESWGYDLNGSGSSDNTLWFYAPVSGTYSLRVFDDDTNSMSYTMQLSSCPVIATVAASDTDYVDSTSSLATSGCQQVYTFFYDGDSSYVNYYLVSFNAGQTRYFGVTSSAFTPGWEVGGPNFDSMWDLDGSGGTSGYGSGTFQSFTSDSAGTYTLAVGSTTYGESGAYRLFVVTESELPQRVPGAPILSTKAVHLHSSQRIRTLR
jgi:hypothetical protein